MRWANSLALAVVLGMPAALFANSPSRGEPVDKQEAAQWTHGLIPLPQEIAIPRKVVVSAARITVTLLPDAGPLEREAAAELADVLAKKAGTRINVGATGTDPNTVAILLGCCGKQGRLGGREVPGAARLWTLPNREQAYRIVPLDARTLAVAGIRPTGVYYAAKTLGQLVAGASSPAQGQAAIPLAEITDWPDLAERGLWGGSADNDIAWLAERKMNLVETHVGLSVDAHGHGVASLSEGLLGLTRRHAVKLVPIVTHLEQLPADVLARLPQLKGVGKHHVDAAPVCFSQPKAEEILADWLTCLARYPDINDVNVWLSEDNVSCQCPKCKVMNPYVLQTQVIVRAWQRARRVKPDLRLRLLLTQGSYTSNAKILAAAPRQVGITYYDGGRTYDSSREPMIYPLLEKYAADGRWLGCYPQLTASWRIVVPWSGPQFIKARMSEFAAKGLQCLCGYATPSSRFYDFNVTAAAEWSWNAHGRSEREFALAWATRQKLAEPEKAADWAVILGPVGWDVYGAHPLLHWIYHGTGELLRSGKRPRLGAGHFVYFPTKEHFDADLAACDRAMSLADAIGSPAITEETHVIRGLVGMLKGLYLMADATAAGTKMTAAERRQAADDLRLLDGANREARKGLLAWGNAVAPQCLTCRFVDTVDCLDQVMTEASDAASRLGIPDPGRCYRVRRIGEWSNDTFRRGPAQQVTWPVSNFVTGPGRYEVAFHFDDRGWQGVEIRDVRLLAGATDAAPQKEVARDAHRGISRYQSENASYQLDLKTYNPKDRYFVIAQLVGARLTGPNDRSASVGSATIRKCQPSDRQSSGH